MLFAQVNEKGQEELKRAMSTASETKWYRRLKTIDLSGQGQRVPAIAKLFDIGEATVRRYITAYNEGGLVQLQPGKSPGRRASILLSKADWEEVIGRRPSQFEKLGTNARNWSQPLLVNYLYHYHQIEVTQCTVSKTLQRQQISWQRAKKK